VVQGSGRVGWGVGKGGDVKMEKVKRAWSTRGRREVLDMWGKILVV
jgi:hypothetical protein